MHSYRPSYRNRFLLATLALIVAALAWSAWPAMPVQRALAQDESAITSPSSGSIVNGVVRIDGTATVGNFQRYELFFKPSNADDSDYTLFEQGTEIVVNGELGFWDTTLIQPDIYTLRLRVVQNDGNYIEAFAENITVDPNYSPTPPPSTNPTPDSSLVPAPTPTAIVPGGSTDQQGTGGEAIGVSRVITGTASRTITMLGRGVAATAPDRVVVRLYIASAQDVVGGPVRPVSEADLQQVAATLQGTGVTLEDVRVIPFSRRPDGSGMVGEVRFTYRQPANLTTFLNDGLTRLTANANVSVVDVAVQYGVANCAALEVEALRSAILAARGRAEPLATVLNVRLGPVLSVSENVAAVPVTGSCLNLLDDTAFLPLSSDTPTQVEVAVTLAVTFVMDTGSADSTTPSTIAPTPTPDFQAAPTPTSAAPTPTQAALLTHIVQPGQTAESIAALYGVTVEALLAANNLSPADTQAIVPGAVLNIPSP